MTTPDDEALLQHADWLRDLATSLVHDRARADDLTQETLLAAWQSRTTAIQQWKAWLSTILRNRLRVAHRDDRRRSMRERSAAAPESTPGSDDLLARLHDQQRLLAAVEQLDEPYRTTILLRYLDGLSPRKIASRMQVSTANVASRRKRGLALLRQRLDRAFGSRDRWLAALIPFARMPWSEAPFWILFMDMKLKLAVTAVVLCLCAFGVWAWQGFGGPTVAPENPNANLAKTSAAIEQGGVAAESPVERRELELPGAKPSMPTTAPAAGTLRTRGLVVLPNGTPVAGVRLIMKGLTPVVTTASGADGRFEMLVSTRGHEIHADDPRYVTVLYGETANGGDADRVVVIAPKSPLTATVTDNRGEPIAAATARLNMPDNLRASLGMVLDYSGHNHWLTTSDASGSIAIEACPAVQGAHLVVTRDGFRAATVDMANGTQGLRIVLDRIEIDGASLCGRIVDREGQFMAATHVSVGQVSTTSDAQGEFRLALDPKAVPATQLMAIKQGFLACRFQLPAKPTYLIVTLDGPALQLSGTVMDSRGRPLVAAKVWVADPEWFGTVDGYLATSEALSGGAMRPQEHQAEWLKLRDLPEAEQARRASPGQQWHFCRTNAQGEFRLEGLGNRTYRVRAMDPDTLQIVEAGPFQAGRDDLRLVMPDGQVYAEIRGKVVLPDQTPVARARLKIGATVITLSTKDMTMSHCESGNTLLTDTDGSFVLHNVPKNGRIDVYGDHIENRQFGGDAAGELETVIGANTDDVRIVVLPRYHLRVELTAAPDLADTIKILDASDQPVAISRIEGTNRYTQPLAKLYEGKSPPLSVGAKARTLVLYKGDKIVRREVLDLRPEIENLLRY